MKEQEGMMKEQEGMMKEMVSFPVSKNISISRCQKPKKGRMVQGGEGKSWPQICTGRKVKGRKQKNSTEYP